MTSLANKSDDAAAHLKRQKMNLNYDTVKRMNNQLLAADRNQWRAICGSKTPSTTKETPTSSRQDIWAKLRYGNVPS
jgi:hypothetical protein